MTTVGAQPDRRPAPGRRAGAAEDPHRRRRQPEHALGGVPMRPQPRRPRRGLPALRRPQLKRPHIKGLRDRDPALVAIVGTLVGALVVLLSMNLNQLPFLTSERHLPRGVRCGRVASIPGSQVRVAGLQVGSVSSVKVERRARRGAVRRARQVSSWASNSDARASRWRRCSGEVFLQVELGRAGRATARAAPSRWRAPRCRTRCWTRSARSARTSQQTNLPQLQQSLRPARRGAQRDLHGRRRVPP